MEEKRHSLKDGREVLVRPLSVRDFEESLAFFNRLPERDRLYLRVDVTDPEVVRHRLRHSHIENVYRVGGFNGAELVADATLAWPQHGWLSHVGEIRVIVDPRWRKAGLATVLYRRLFIHGVRTGLEKLQVWMMPQQQAARACVEKLGFAEEGVYPGFVLDQAGRQQDLVIMSASV